MHKCWIYRWYSFVCFYLWRSLLRHKDIEWDRSEIAAKRLTTHIFHFSPASSLPHFENHKSLSDILLLLLLSSLALPFSMAIGFPAVRECMAVFVFFSSSYSLSEWVGRKAITFIGMYCCAYKDIKKSSITYVYRRDIWMRAAAHIEMGWQWQLVHNTQIVPTAGCFFFSGAQALILFIRNRELVLKYVHGRRHSTIDRTFNFDSDIIN